MLPTRLLLGLSLVVFVLEANGLLTSSTHWGLTKLVKLRKLKRIMEDILKTPDGMKALTSVQTGWIQQTLDHFNLADTRYFYQRYYVSTQYWNPSSGPVFVYVGGEDELFPGYLAGGKNE